MKRVAIAAAVAAALFSCASSAAPNFHDAGPNLADNGASGEGSPNGSVNENRFFNAYPDDLESNLAMIDQLGSPDT